MHSFFSFIGVIMLNECSARALNRAKVNDEEGVRGSHYLAHMNELGRNCVNNKCIHNGEELIKRCYGHSSTGTTKG